MEATKQMASASTWPMPPRRGMAHLLRLSAQVVDYGMARPSENIEYDVSLLKGKEPWSGTWQPLTMLIFSATNVVSKINMEPLLCRKPKFTLRIMKLEFD